MSRRTKEEILRADGGTKRIRESIGVRSPTGKGTGTHGPAPETLKIPESHIGVSRLKGAQSIALDRIIPDPSQPRKRFDSAGLDRLAESIQAKGQIQPVRVRWDEPLERYVIIAGERRWRAAGQAGLAQLACILHDGPLPPDELLALQLIENCIREDLNPIERARAFRALMRQRKCTYREAAAFVGVDHTGVFRGLRMLKLPKSVQKTVEEGRLSGTAAVELTRVNEPTHCQELADRAVAEKWTRDRLRSEITLLCGTTKSTPIRSQVPAPEPDPSPETDNFPTGIPATAAPENRAHTAPAPPTEGEITAAVNHLVGEIHAATPPESAAPSGQAREVPYSTEETGHHPSVGVEDLDSTERVWMVDGPNGTAIVTVNLPPGESDPIPALSEALRRARNELPPPFKPGGRVRITTPNGTNHKYHGYTGTVEDKPPGRSGSIWIIVDVPGLRSGHRCLYHPDQLERITAGGAR